MVGVEEAVAAADKCAISSWREDVNSAVWCYQYLMYLEVKTLIHSQTTAKTSTLLDKAAHHHKAALATGFLRSTTTTKVARETARAGLDQVSLVVPSSLRFEGCRSCHVVCEVAQALRVNPLTSPVVLPTLAHNIAQCLLLFPRRIPPFLNRGTSPLLHLIAFLPTKWGPSQGVAGAQPRSSLTVA